MAGSPQPALATASPHPQPLFAAAFLLVVALSALLRLYRISDFLPILVDEAIYLRWAEIIDHQGEWFISLLDGKQPLSYWLLYLARKILPDDPLLAGRLISVASGVLTTAAIFGLGYRLHGLTSAASAALLYAFLPYAVIYDHIAYTDSLVGLFAVLIAWASVECFRPPDASWTRTFGVAAALSVGVMIKSTAMQFAGLPLLIGLAYKPTSAKLLASRMAVILGGPALLLSLTSTMSPDGPRFAQINSIVHRSDFFVPVSQLTSSGLLQFNCELLRGYIAAYVTWPVALCGAAGVFLMIRRREWASVAVVAAVLLPILLQVGLLVYFPSRYVFPHTWVIVMACAYVVGLSGRAGLLLLALLMLPLSLRVFNLLGQPEFCLHPRDAAEFTSSGPYSGYGVREAIDFLLRQGDERGFTVLTDPYWGPPADAIFVYLQGRKNISVYEAWWLQVDDEKHPIVPAGSIPVMKSQYQRVSAGSVDFATRAVIYYVTDTNYFTPVEVLGRQPRARLAARFPKRNGRDFIDVYRVQ